jgi:hypothetical protein
MPSAEMPSYKPTSRYRCAYPDLDYFQFADDLSLIEPRESRARQMPAYQA